MIHYAGRLFRAVALDGEGDVSAETVFRYDQRGDTLLGSYSGGDVDFGSIVGRVLPDGSLTFLYHHRTKGGALRSGSCESTPAVLPNGKVRLHERWEWHGGGSGTSVLEEL